MILVAIEPYSKKQKVERVLQQTAAIVQSNYIPWKGYFDLIAAVDTFILYDDVQFTRRDWRNRNLIKTPHGVQYLTVPVKSKGRYDQLIRETEIDGDDWARDHWRAFEANYRRAPHSEEVFELLRPHFRPGVYTMLSDLNRGLLATICRYLGIETIIRSSSEFDLVGDRSERLAGMSVQAGAETYVSGPSARNYLDERTFGEKGLRVRWFDYDGYPQYPQLWGEFRHGVSIVDLMFACGKTAPQFMKLGQRMVSAKASGRPTSQ